MEQLTEESELAEGDLVIAPWTDSCDQYYAAVVKKNIGGVVQLEYVTDGTVHGVCASCVARP